MSRRIATCGNRWNRIGNSGRFGSAAIGRWSAVHPDPIIFDRFPFSRTRWLSPAVADEIADGAKHLLEVGGRRGISKHRTKRRHDNAGRF
jgi:hypothetical protein